MSDIVLSAGVRQNLLSLQSTSSLMSLTQNRLATGKKVNSALDNPGNFFTSQALGNRAGELNSLLDSIGQAQQTLKAADSGLTALSKLVESAKSIAKQAQQAPRANATAYAAINFGSTITGAESLATHTGGNIVAADSTLYSFTVDVNGGGPVTISYTSGVGATISDIQDGLIADFESKINSSDLTIDASGSGLKIDAVNADIDFQIGAGAGNSGLTAATYQSTSLFDRLVTAGGADGDTLSIAVNGSSTPTVVTFGTGPGEVSTMAEFDAALGSLGSAAGVALSLNVAASSGTQNSLGLTSSSAGLASLLGLASQNVTTQGTATPGTPNSTRASLENDYNNVLSQIDALVKDASYNGVNLLSGDDFKVIFNETGTSFLSITGVTFDAAGLGLGAITSGTFQSDASIDAEFAKLDTATRTLRNQASQFGSNLTTVQIRQDFTQSLIATLSMGSDKLVLADTNEEGANLLALQTRQQLSTTALSLSAQADQAVLRLFG